MKAKSIIEVFNNKQYKKAKEAGFIVIDRRNEKNNSNKSVPFYKDLLEESKPE
jgi:hypothetical protein